MTLHDSPGSVAAGFNEFSKVFTRIPFTTQFFTHLHNEKDLYKLRLLSLEYWTKEPTFSFVCYTVQSFLRKDLYNSLTEFMNRAGGSFVISTLP